MVQSEMKRPYTFFPTAINTYRDCPEKYYHQYIRKLKRPMPFSRPMVTGGATHRTIARVLPQFLQTGEIAADLDARAMQELSTTTYPDDEREFLEQDTQRVVELTHTALEMMPAGAQSLLQERKLYARVGGGVQVAAQIDLVLQRPDGTVEHVDFKTGRRRDNTVQSLIARTVVGRRFRVAEEIRTTTLYLAQRKLDSDTLNREEVRPAWEKIARDIKDMRSLDHFQPRPGPLCEYCPYKARDCSVM